MATSLLYPAFVQVLVTFALCIWMGKLRIAELKKGDVKVKEVADRTANWKDQTRRVELALYNQFQVPMLFFVGCLFAIQFGQADYVTTILAWIFVLLRLIQIYAHIVTNNVKMRFNAFLGGFLVVLAIWVYIIVNVTSSLAI